MILSRRDLRRSRSGEGMERLCVCQPRERGRIELSRMRRREAGTREGGRECLASIIVKEVVVVVVRSLDLAHREYSEGGRKGEWEGGRGVVASIVMKRKHTPAQHAYT